MHTDGHAVVVWWGLTTTATGALEHQPLFLEQTAINYYPRQRLLSGQLVHVRGWESGRLGRVIIIFSTTNLVVGFGPWLKFW